MHPTLTKLFMGLCPNEEFRVENPNYDPTMKELCEMENALRSTLKGRPLGQLEKLINAQQDICSMQTTASFIFGFRLAAQLMLEIFTPNE